MSLGVIPENMPKKESKTLLKNLLYVDSASDSFYASNTNPRLDTCTRLSLLSCKYVYVHAWHEGMQHISSL